MAAKKERRIEFFKRLDAKLDYTFSRKVDTCEDQEEIIKECIETLKAYVEDFDSEKFFIYDYEEYVNKFIDISCYQNVYTIDVLEPNSRLLEKY